MRRIAYFGTTGKGSGHNPLCINGCFDSFCLCRIADIDCDSGHALFKPNRFTLTRFRNYTVFGFPASPDDNRGGSLTCVLVDGDASRDEFIRIINNNHFLSTQFKALEDKFNCKMEEVK